jgi:outer membrane protein OmpA-like peptidoglycan-associated protein
MKLMLIRLAAIGLCTPFIACAPGATSAQLVDARRSYEHAKEYKSVVPDEVHSAKQALQKAEHASDEDPGSKEERHLAYLAERRAQMVVAKGELKIAQMKTESAEERYSSLLAKKRVDAERSLEATRQALDANRTELDRLREQLTSSDGAVDDLKAREAQLTAEQQELQAQLEAKETALERERIAREEAEARAAAALQSLKEVALVKEEANETTITLSGTVLSKTGESQMLPIARATLDRVARALLDLEENSELIVEGHTDSRGTQEFNDTLSLERARSVRSYLIEQGVPADRIRAIGRGENEPIATNQSAEGRANNRRVEIVIRKPHAGGVN